MSVVPFNRRYAFDEVWERLHPDRSFVGPLPPVDDHRFAAGLLFSRWNDGTKRVLKAYSDGHPRIEVTSRHRTSVVPVTKEAVKTLRDERLVEPIPEWPGYVNQFEFRLTTGGKRRVVTEWFAGSCTQHDLFIAGAIIGEPPGKVSWP